MNDAPKGKPDGDEPVAPQGSRPRSRQLWRHHPALNADPLKALRAPRTRLGQMRVVLLAVQLVVLFTVVGYFVVRPYYLDASKHKAQAPVIRRSPLGAQVPVLGSKAAALRGVREVTPAYLAQLEGLAPGSVAAQEAQAMESRRFELPIEIENSVGMRFRLVPAGTCLVGSPPTEPGRWDGEAQHVAVVPETLYVGKFEVTQAQWQAVMGTNPSGFRGPQHPVEEVTWYDCQRFTIRLCEREGVPVGTYRLPTEAEWEYACRAGTTTAYCFGDDPAWLGEYDIFLDNHSRGPADVGTMLPNALGLYNMHGNVWEWCIDVFKAYPGTKPPDEDVTGWRIIRGGNWYQPAPACRSANRCRLPASSHGNMLGVRIVRALTELAKPVAAGSAMGQTPSTGSTVPPPAPGQTSSPTPATSATAPLSP